MRVFQIQAIPHQHVAMQRRPLGYARSVPICGCVGWRLQRARFNKRRLVLKALFCAAMAATALLTAPAFARGGGGDGGINTPQGYQEQQAREAYLINQERQWQLAHGGNHNSVAQSVTSSNG
jgi:hypothetical protein